MLLSVVGGTMDQYKFGTIKLKKTVQILWDVFLVWQWKCGCSRTSTISCFKVMLVVFCLPKLAVVSWPFTAGGQCDLSGRHSCAHSHWDIKDLVLASRNLAVRLVHQIVAELLYHGTLQNYFCRIKWNCGVTVPKNTMVDWHWGAPHCLACEAVSLLCLGLAFPKASCFSSCLSSLLRACHVTKLI